MSYQRAKTRHPFQVHYPPRKTRKKPVSQNRCYNHSCTSRTKPCQSVCYARRRFLFVPDDQIGPFTHFWGNEITRILPGYSIPPRRTLRSNITAALFHARQIKTGLPFQVDRQKLRPSERVILRLKAYQF